ANGPLHASLQSGFIEQEEFRVRLQKERAFILTGLYFIRQSMRRLRVKLILPALTEATDPCWRPIKYSLFPPLGLATLAAFLDPDDETVLVDEHVTPLDCDDRPDLVLIQVYITNAFRAY